MIIIDSPSLQEENGFTKIASEFSINGKSEKLWYLVPSRFKDYLVTENCDSFLVGLLFLGLKTGNNISIKGTVSSRLLYNINHYLIPALCLTDPDLHPMKVYADKTSEEDLNVGRVAATGFSGGVDSFATYVDHLEETGSLKIKYFTFFNAGSHGSGGEKTRKIFHDRLEKVKKFANKVGLEIITVDSNISEILDIKFQQTNTLRNMSCALLFQKLFKNYYSASKNRFDYFKLHKYDSQDYDALNLNLLSTESTNLISAVANYTRLERTALISEYEPSFYHLDVCTSPKRQVGGKNCSDCNKCRRTALTLDLLGKLQNYEPVFDIKRYEEKKHSYINHIISTRKTNQISKDIYDLLKEKNEIDYVAIAKSKLASVGRKFGS